MAGRHIRHFPGHTVGRTVAIVVTAALAFGVTSAAAVYARLQGNIDTVDVSGLLGPSPTGAADPDDPFADQAINFVVMGLDDRSGANADLVGDPGEEGMRSDTTILVHISGDRSRVELVSIPRDSWVQIPACKRSDGSSSKAQKSKFNAAFAFGAESGERSDAAACTLTTLTSLTGIWLEDYVVVDFAGFRSMVDALGGVPICIPENLKSPKAGLDLKAGYQTLNGDQALALARARYGVDDGSDTSRISRQQELIAATVREVFSKSLLTDVPSLLQFLDAATSSLTTSPRLGSLQSLAGLGWSLRGVPLNEVTFITVPWGDLDGSSVVWTPDAAKIWSAIQADTPVAAALAPSPTPTPTPKPGATTRPPTPTGTPTTGSTPSPTPTTVDPKSGLFTAGDTTATC